MLYVICYMLYCLKCVQFSLVICGVAGVALGLGIAKVVYNKIQHYYKVWEVGGAFLLS